MNTELSLIAKKDVTLCSLATFIEFRVLFIRVNLRSSASHTNQNTSAENMKSSVPFSFQAFRGRPALRQVSSRNVWRLQL